MHIITLYRNVCSCIILLLHYFCFVFAIECFVVLDACFIILRIIHTCINIVETKEHFLHAYYYNNTIYRYFITHVGIQMFIYIHRMSFCTRTNSPSF